VFFVQFRNCYGVVLEYMLLLRNTVDTKVGVIVSVVVVCDAFGRKLSEAFPKKFRRGTVWL